MGREALATMINEEFVFAESRIDGLWEPCVTGRRAELKSPYDRRLVTRIVLHAVLRFTRPICNARH